MDGVTKKVTLEMLVEGSGKTAKEVKKVEKGLITLTDTVKRFNSGMLSNNQLLAQHKANLEKTTKQGTAQRLANQFDSFGGAMRLTLPQMKQIDAGGARMNTKMGRLGLGLRKATHGMRGFRMEMLGVMFFGMMLARTFSQMLRPAAEAFGIFDLWNTMLMVLFLPIMQELFPYFLDLVNFFIELPEPVKKTIGLFVLLALAFGVVIMVVGQLALGIGSLILAHAIVLPIIAIFVFMGYVILGLIFLIGGLRKVFEGDFSAISDVLIGIGILFSLIGDLSGLIFLGVALALKSSEERFEWFEKILGKFKNFFSKIWEDLTYSLSILWIDMKIDFLQAIESMTKKVIKFIQFMATIPIIGIPFKMAAGLAEGFKTATGTVIAQLEEEKRFKQAFKQLQEIAAGDITSMEEPNEGWFDKFSQLKDKFFTDGLGMTDDQIAALKPLAVPALTGGEFDADKAAGQLADLEGRASNVTFNNETNISVVDKFEMEKYVDERDKGLLDKLFAIAAGLK